jgi:hypothetical protein
MAEYKSEALGVSFEMPDRVTVRQQLAYRGQVALAASDNTFAVHWKAAQPLLQNWACEKLPDPAAVDLDEETDTAVADIVTWTANTAAGHMLALRATPKNS